MKSAKGKEPVAPNMITGEVQCSYNESDITREEGSGRGVAAGFQDMINDAESRGYVLHDWELSIATGNLVVEKLVAVFVRVSDGTDPEQEAGPGIAMTQP